MLVEELAQQLPVPWLLSLVILLDGLPLLLIGMSVACAIQQVVVQQSELMFGRGSWMCYPDYPVAAGVSRPLLVHAIDWVVAVLVLGQICLDELDWLYQQWGPQ